MIFWGICKTSHKMHRHRHCCNTRIAVFSWIQKKITLKKKLLFFYISQNLKKSKKKLLGKLTKVFFFFSLYSIKVYPHIIPHKINLSFAGYKHWLLVAYLNHYNSRRLKKKKASHVALQKKKKKGSNSLFFHHEWGDREVDRHKI